MKTYITSIAKLSIQAQEEKGWTKYKKTKLTDAHSAMKVKRFKNKPATKAERVQRMEVY